MVTERETTRIVRSWLEEGRTTLPDFVLDAVLDQLPATRQHRPSWPMRRIAHMNAFAKFATAAAAVVLVAVVGVSLIPGIGPAAPGPTATPTPSPTPTTTPTSTAPLVGAGPIAPGRYAWEWPAGRVSFDVPAGWTGLVDDRITRNGDQPSYIEITPWFPGTAYAVTQVYSDSCAPGETLTEVGPTTAELVAALQAQGSMDASVTELQIGGRPASRVDLVVEPGLDTATCRHAPDGPIQVWYQNEQAGYLALASATDGTYGTAVIWSVDVEGGPLVISSFSNVDTDPADVAAIEAMIDSMTFD